MTRYFLLLSVVGVTFLSGCGNVQSQNSTFNLTAKEFAEKIKQLPEAPVIDVRTPQEFSTGHLQNVKNIDWNGSRFQTEISKLDKTKPVFVYCLSGGRSAAAADQMRSDGFKEVYEMQGGMMKWRAANLPETTTNRTKQAGMTPAQFNALIHSDKMVLVDFYAEWCGPCKKMEPYLKEIARDMAGQLEVVRINTDDNLQLCKELNIDAIPVLHLYKNKTLAWSNSGYISKEEVLKKLR